jgi:hypothetical protein
MLLFAQVAQSYARYHAKIYLYRLLQGWHDLGKNSKILNNAQSKQADESKRIQR